MEFRELINLPNDSMQFLAYYLDLLEDKIGLAAMFQRACHAATEHAAEQLEPRGKTELKEEPTNARKSFGDVAPHLAEITDKVLFGDVWENSALSPRDRSLITITSLISLYRINEMPFHMQRAMDNGVTRDEIIGTITHLAFYAGWPPAMTALQIARKLFEKAGQ